MIPNPLPIVVSEVAFVYCITPKVLQIIFSGMVMWGNGKVKPDKGNPPYFLSE
jgi:hypothetical protein